MRRLITFIIILGIGCTTRAAVIPMSREALIQEAGFIFSGQVIKKESHWNVHKNLIVTDYTFSVDKNIFQDKPTQAAIAESPDWVTLTFAGGKIGDRVHTISEVPSFEMGERVLLMVEDVTTRYLSPIVGSNQGQFVAKAIEGPDGIQQATTQESHIMQQADGSVIPFDIFVIDMEQEVKRVKSKMPLEIQMRITPQAAPFYPESKQYDYPT